MKKVLLPLSALALLAVLALVITREKAPPAPAMINVPSRPGAERPTAPATPVSPTVPPSDDRRNGPSAPAAESSAPAAPVVEMKPAPADPFDPVFSVLLSSETNLGQKRALWNQLRMDGKLEQALADLEQRRAANPSASEIPTAIGEALLYSIAGIEDVREQGIRGMKADLSFDAALKLDPANWEAGFYKATALSRWPESMNMGPKVVQQFTDLIQLQERLPARSEFVQSYILLGEQYQKAGQPDNARQTWERGALLFPGNPALTSKLNPGQ